MAFTSSESWTILSPIEQRIKAKIEAVGTPLKDWAISINYGIKTGCNDAFIISGAKKDELIAADPKSAEIIRPILRGRDIKRYEYNFADLWLIATFPSRNYNIDDYPAVRDYLLSYGIERLEQTGKTHAVNGKSFKARKKTNNKWFETQDSIKYWNDFFKPKIVYREISTAMDACLVEPGIMLNNKCYLITGDHLEYLLVFFNSSLFTKIILPQVNITGGKGEGFLSTVYAKVPSLDEECYIKTLLKQRSSADNAEALKDIDAKIDAIIMDIYGLTETEKTYLFS